MNREYIFYGILIALPVVLFLIDRWANKSSSIEWRVPTEDELRERKIYPFAVEPLNARLDGDDGWIELVDSEGRKAMFTLSFELDGVTREEAMNAKYELADGREGTLVDLVHQVTASFAEHYPKIIERDGGSSDNVEMGVEIFFDGFGAYMSKRCPALADRSIICSAHATFRSVAYHQNELRKLNVTTQMA